MATQKQVHNLKEQYRRLKQELAQVGLVAMGTITPRTITRPDPHNRRRKKTYGPYYQWTYKVRGKTVTVNLTQKQTIEFQKAIDNQRRLEGVLSKMLQVSRAILQETTVGVSTRIRAPERISNA